MARGSQHPAVLHAAGSAAGFGQSAPGSLTTPGSLQLRQRATFTRMRRHRLYVLLALLCAATSTGAEFGATRRVTHALVSSAGPSVSSDGRYVGYSSGATKTYGKNSPHYQYYITDRRTRRTNLLSVSSRGRMGNGDSGGGSLSADGRYAAFASTASNLVPHDDNRTYDVFVRDRGKHTTIRVSVASDASESHPASLAGAPVVSSDGRFVAFFSDAPDLVPNDRNGTGDVFLHDCQTGTTTRVSVATDGSEGNGASDPESVAMSSDARFIAFYSQATNLVPAGPGYCAGGTFLRDQVRQTTFCVAKDGLPTSLSADGRFLAYVALPYPGNMFVYDRVTATTTKLNVGTPEMPLAGGSNPAISDDGHYAIFVSFYGNLDSAVFLRDLVAGTTEPVSVGPHGVLRPATDPAISGDGRVIVFASDFGGLVSGQPNKHELEEVYERASRR